MKSRCVTQKQPAPLDILLDPTIHTVYKEQDASLLFGHNYLTSFATLEFWTWLYMDSHGRWLSRDVSIIIICLLHNMLLIIILTLQQ